MKFDLLSRLYADAPTEAVFSEAATVGGWLRVEAALARALAEAGIVFPSGRTGAVSRE